MAHFTRTDIRFQVESNLTPSRTDHIRFQILLGQIFDQIFLMNEKLFCLLFTLFIHSVPDIQFQK